MRSSIHLRDHHRESQLFSGRVLAALFIVTLLTLTLVGRMLWLQWLQYERFALISDNNRIQTQPLPPPRGLILDRNGVVIADNRADFSLVMVPEQVVDLDATLGRIAELIDFPEEELQRFRERLRSRVRPWDPVQLRSGMTEQEIAVIAAAQHELPGVRISAEAIRHYPWDDLFSHVLGYVNRINTQDLAAMDEATRADYAGTHYFGRTGIERQYESQLHGAVGYRKVETNAWGRSLNVVEEDPPTPGKDLHLYLDLRVQQAAWEALGDRRGAVVAIDPRNGGILGFVSRPGINPNLFVTGISHHDYGNYRDDPDRPLFNRALQGQYPPGSTIKPMVGLAGLEHRATWWSKEIHDPGIFTLPETERTYRDWKREGHGTVDMHKAIVESCDVYFYKLSMDLGIDRYHDFLSRFGFGAETGVDMPGERAGLLPSRAWKRGARGAGWFHGDTVNASIGQGFVLSTPLQLAVGTAILAQKGQAVTPRVARDHALPEATAQPVSLRNERDWERMHAAMGDVVHGLRGTARSTGYGAKYRIAGKSGTAQVFSVAQDEEYNKEEVAERLRDHALFVAFAPLENPAIAVAVLVENGSSGGSVAGPVARAVMDAWLLDENGELAVPAAEPAPAATPVRVAEKG